MLKILVINGVNLNMLGRRDLVHYGKLTLDELNGEVDKYARSVGVQAEFFTTNSESEIIDKMQSTSADGIVLNAGAYTHYSYAIRDCIECISQPVVEAHLSDVNNREAFRKTRVFADVVAGFYCGEKQFSYFKAIDKLKEILTCSVDNIG